MASARAELQGFYMQAGVIFFSAAYLAEDSSSSLRVMALSPTTQFGVIATHLVPFHCCTFTEPEPSWSSQEVFTTGNMPSAPKAF